LHPLFGVEGEDASKGVPCHLPEGLSIGIVADPQFGDVFKSRAESAPHAIQESHNSGVFFVLSELQDCDGSPTSHSATRLDVLHDKVGSPYPVVGLMPVSITSLSWVLVFEPLLGENTGLKLEAWSVSVVLEHFWIPQLASKRN